MGRTLHVLFWLGLPLAVCFYLVLCAAAPHARAGQYVDLLPRDPLVYHPSCREDGDGVMTDCEPCRDGYQLSVDETGLPVCTREDGE